MYRLKYSVRKSKRKGNLQFDGLLGGKDQPHLHHPSWAVIIPLIRSPYFQHNTFARQDIWVHDISMVQETFSDNAFKIIWVRKLGQIPGLKRFMKQSDKCDDRISPGYYILGPRIWAQSNKIIFFLLTACNIVDTNCWHVQGTALKEIGILWPRIFAIMDSP